MAETYIDNPAAPITRQDLTAQGVALNEYRENPSNKDFHRISLRAKEIREKELGINQKKEVNTLDEMWPKELLKDDPADEEEAFFGAQKQRVDPALE